MSKRKRKRRSNRENQRAVPSQQAISGPPAPVGVTDYISQALQHSSVEDLSSPFSPTREQREMVLLSGLTVAVIETELELLKAEALEGSVCAAEALHRIASLSTTHLVVLASRVPEIVMPIAEHESVWPVPYSEAARHKKVATELVAAIGLGSARTGPLDAVNVLSEDTLARKVLFTITRSMERIRTEALRQQERQRDLAPVREFMDSIGLAAPPEAITEALYEDLQSLAVNEDEIESLSSLLRIEQPLKRPDTLGNLINGSARLPELTAEPAAIEAWMLVIKQFLMDVCEDKPETTALETLGRFQASNASGSYRSNVRVGIWVVLKRALGKIAKTGREADSPQE